MQDKIGVAFEVGDMNTRLFTLDRNGRCCVFAHIGNSDYSPDENHRIARYVSDILNKCGGDFFVPDMP
jgi:hypothetical protein